jgi:hypothetical protein
VERKKQQKNVTRANALSTATAVGVGKVTADACRITSIARFAAVAKHKARLAHIINEGIQVN